MLITWLTDSSNGISFSTCFVFVPAISHVPAVALSVDIDEMMVLVSLYRAVPLFWAPSLTSNTCTPSQPPSVNPRFAVIGVIVLLRGLFLLFFWHLDLLDRSI